MRVPIILIVLLYTPASAVEVWSDTCHRETDRIQDGDCSDDLTAGREYLNAWIENMSNAHFTAGPAENDSSHCKSSLAFQSCSWGPCDGDFTGPGSLTLTDGRLVTGSVEAGRMSGPVNITDQKDSLLQVLII